VERLTSLCWVLLAAVHAMPAAVLFRPQLTQAMYGVPAAGAAGLLIVHRGALFLAVLVVALYAAFDVDARRAASLVVGISVVGFLIVYALLGAPAGALRTIAIVDAVALLPLGLVAYRAWFA
jgi:hypothetical protein